MRWILLSALLSQSAFAAEVFPFVQTHTFELEPYMPRAQGYAFFVASPSFDGTEEVTIQAPSGVLLPDIHEPRRRLDKFDGGQWLISDQARIASATSGALPAGRYLISIRRKDEEERSEFDFTPSYIAPATGIRLSENGDLVRAQWTPVDGADSYWVFVVRSDSAQILKDLRPVSSVIHRAPNFEFKKSSLEPGAYRVAIRTNQFWEAGSFWGYKSEAWSISSGQFTVP